MAEHHEEGTVLPRCFLDIAIDGEMVGRIVVELFSNVCPKTCENFRALCTGEKSTSQYPLHYKNSPFHRIVKNFMVQGGDFINGNGTGGESIYGHIFPDENFTLKHDRDFIVSMANKGPNSNGSQFFVLTKPAPHLDGIHVVFGRVVNSDGKRIVKMIESEKVDENYRPFRNISIVNSGELMLLKKSKPSKRKKHEAKEKESSSVSSSSSSSSSSSESESDKSDKKKKKKKKKQKKKAKKAKKKKSKSKKSSDEELPKPEVDSDYVCSVRPDEIPPVPSHRFLQRTTVQIESSVPSYVTVAGPLSSSRSSAGPSGKIVKGRGSFRYNPRRSSSPEYRSERDLDRRYGRMRSDEYTVRHRNGNEEEEPEHWRRASQNNISLKAYEQWKKSEQERAMVEAEHAKMMADAKRREEQRQLQYQLKEIERRERDRHRDRSRSRSRSRRRRRHERDDRRDDDVRRRSGSREAQPKSISPDSDNRSFHRSDSRRRRVSRKSPSNSPPARREIEADRERNRLRSHSPPRHHYSRSSSRDRGSPSSSESSSSASRSRSRDRSWRRR